MSVKPLGRKAYGSIPHLIGSRRGPGDKGVNEGQQRIATEKARDKHDRIIVQTKLDGSNCAVAKVNGEIVPITRAGYHANSSPFPQHHMFAKWVLNDYKRFDAVLKEGEWLVGEWLAQAHGTVYNLPHEPFVVFDLMRERNGAPERSPYPHFAHRTSGFDFTTPMILHEGSPLSVLHALELLHKTTCKHGTQGKPEGAVWRVERRGKVDFLAKYVRPDKVDGCYLPELTGKDPVWNWQS
jgi:hypothetical protein